MNATYDAVKAFEINATYNDLHNVADTLREDVEAAISTFMNSMSTNLGVSGYREETMKSYVPAILFTLYDGYYIYSPSSEDSSAEGKYTLKPYNYYSVRYKQDDANDVVINYTLDNYMVVYGWIDREYYVKSGYLVTDSQTVVSNEEISVTVPWQEIGNNNQSGIVDESHITSKSVTNDNYSPDYINNIMKTGGTDTRTDSLFPRNEDFYINPESASKYYKDSATFTTWVTSNLNWVTAKMAMRNNEYLYDTDEWFDNNNTKVFALSSSNNPEDPNSAFSEHKTNVIRNSIQNNLNEAIASYSKKAGGSYEFRLPQLKTEEWDRVATNVCMLTFFQGLPVGTKYYNNYSLVTSTTNKLYFSKDNMYFTSDGDNYYHLIDCDHIENESNLVGFSAFDYEIKRVKNARGGYFYYYKHYEGNEPKKACYYCIVSSGYKRKDIADLSANRQRAYYTALAREKHMRYITTNYFGSR